MPEADSTTKAAPLIAFVDNRLSLHVQTQSLKDIVEQISDLSGVPIFFSKDITDRGVSHHFDNVLLDEGLRMVLQALDLFFFYAADGQVSPALLAVWAYPQGQGKRLVPMPPEAWASTAELREHLRDADPELRVRAAEGLIERQGKQALDVVEAALEDAEAKVRYRALYKAIRVGVPLHGDVLRQLLSADPSPTVRFLALEALPKVPHIQPETLRESLEFALSDADEGVREQAGALLDELEPIDVLLAPEDPLQTQLQERSRRATAAP